MVIPLVFFFFLWSKYGKLVSYKLVSPVDDFNALSTIFMFFLNFFFDEQLPVPYLKSSEYLKFLKTSSPKRNARHQLAELNFPRWCRESKTNTFVVVFSTLNHCRLCFSGMRFDEISFLILGN